MDALNNSIYKISSYIAHNPIIGKSSYSQDPSRYLDFSWIAFGSVQSPGLDLEPKGVTRFFCNQVILHITRSLGNQVIHRTHLDTWIPLGLHLDWSKVLSWTW